MAPFAFRTGTAAAAPLAVLALAFAVLLSASARAQEPAAAPAQPTAAPAGSAQPAPALPVRALVFLKDGQQLRGTLVARDATGATLELEGGSRVTVPEGSILRIETAKPGEAKLWSADPGRTRYLYSPSGFMLDRGEGYISQTELLVTTVAYGVSDHVTVGLGTAIPFLFVEDGVNLLAMLKVGGSLGDYVHVAVAGQILWLPGVEAGTTGGLLLGTITLGTPDAHLGVSAGPPFVTGTEGNEVGDVVLSLSGNYRVSERIALVSENWLLPGADNAFLLSGAVRFVGQRLGVDAGLIYAEGTPVPIPWLDFTFSFGRR
jgi:hypothetical protein